MVFSYVLIVVTLIIVVSYVIQPLFLVKVKKPVMIEQSLDILKQRKKIVYRQIKEAEMEFEMGNLSDEDYIRTRTQLKKEASELIKQIQSNPSK